VIGWLIALLVDQLTNLLRWLCVCAAQVPRVAMHLVLSELAHHYEWLPSRYFRELAFACSEDQLSSMRTVL
jgi:hypothetical protein